ncbi:MAG: DUF4294 domain-containing protein [Bacteroidales bacterium]|nr:DUF4294 domain-containing protein [Bacteroidales bacterium]
MKYRRLIVFLLILLPAVTMRAQEPLDQSPNYQLAVIIGGDTIPRYYLRDLNVVKRVSLSEDEIKKNKRLIRNIKKMLPYAKAARRELDIIDREASGLSKSERRKYMKAKEDEIMDRYADELKKCTVTQGKVLLKLLDRETGKSAYTCVGELRGKVRAGFYQSFAWIFGFKLKARYDPEHNKEDNLIERITLYVESGRL